MKVLDAVVIGAGPTGIGASLAFSGWRPHYRPLCALEDARLAARLKQTPDGLIDAPLVRDLAAGLRGRSNNPSALLYDALQHPGVDRGLQMSSCLELRHDPNAVLDHIVLDPLRLGGAWHSMHEATRTLSPGPWMEMPNFSLAAHLRQVAQAAQRPLSASDAAQQAQARQQRSTIASYYEALGDAFDVARHHRPARAVAVRWRPPPLGGVNGSASDLERDLEHAQWEIATDDGSAPLYAHNIVLAIGTWGVPRRLGLPGEELPIVSHRCTAETADASVTSVLVIGAGLSAADCIVHHLRSGRRVHHLFRGRAEDTKVGSKFGAEGARSFYPEYYALATAMGAPDAPATTLLGGTYTPLGGATLQHIDTDGTCALTRTTAGGDKEAHPTATANALATVVADRIVILVGSDPDLSFLPAEVLSAFAAAGTPPQTLDGVKATHEVFLDVDPLTYETKAWPGLFACGPLRGDNFARFAMHDGHGVAAALRARRHEGGRAGAPAAHTQEDAARVEAAEGACES